MSFNRMVIVHEEFGDSVPQNCEVEGLESDEMLTLREKLGFYNPMERVREGYRYFEFSFRASRIIPILESMGYEFYKAEAHGPKGRSEAKWILLKRIEPEKNE